MLKHGEVMIGYNPLASMKLGNFFRLPFISPSLTDADLDRVLHLIATYGDAVAHDVLAAVNKAEQAELAAALGQ
jgi:hypothetical protein